MAVSVLKTSCRMDLHVSNGRLGPSFILVWTRGELGVDDSMKSAMFSLGVNNVVLVCATIIGWRHGNLPVLVGRP